MTKIAPIKWHRYGAVAALALALTLSGLIGGAPHARAAGGLATFVYEQAPAVAPINQPTTYTVFVSAPQQAPLPTGAVSLSTGESVPLPSTTCVDESNGSVQCSAQIAHTWAQSGTHSLTFSYSGDATYAPSSSTISQQVQAQGFLYEQEPTVAIAGQPATYTVFLAVPLSNPLPTGTISLSTGETASLPGACSVESNGSLSCSVLIQHTWSKAGTFGVTATYSGNNWYLPASSTFSQKVKARTFVYTQSPVDALAGQPANITVWVSAPQQTPLPTGTVSLSTGETAMLQAGTCVYESNGSVQCPVRLQHTWTQAGRFSVTASYSGDTNFFGSSTAFSQQVQAHTFVYAQEPITAYVGVPARYTVFVSIPQLSPLPTGTVELSTGEYATISPASCVTESNGSVQCAVVLYHTWSYAGTYSLSARYLGDSNYIGSSVTFSQNVQL